ncbi:TPA: helix-turn-helix transcriptional regulator [Salmonella enterica]|nr:helix-turn-helix transcriptional regulator [Salmonella enterica subsp. enterica serovar Newport]EDM1756935.1 transcriptional regulator [Salmonella enterica subsp. diarizonae]HEA0864536.1 helix-turn-helix transcriptional regulator [Salmonella enterica]
MSTHIGKKIREIRDSEGLSRAEFAELTGIPAPTQKNYETERRDSVGSDILMKITNHPRFKKYTLWLMSEDDEAYSEAEQISPALSPSGQSSTSSRPKRKKAG